MELFEDKDISDELATSLQVVLDKKTTARIAFNQASEDLKDCESRFWELVYKAMPEYEDYYVNVNVKNKKIHAESEK